jgi:hypothetical protein
MKQIYISKELKIKLKAKAALADMGLQEYADKVILEGFKALKSKGGSK